MFSNGRYTDVFNEFKHAVEAHDNEKFVQILDREFKNLCADRDELRMLFYLAIYVPDDLFAMVVHQYYEAQRPYPSDYMTRIPVLIEALHEFIAFSHNHHHLNEKRLVEIEVALKKFFGHKADSQKS